MACEWTWIGSPRSDGGGCPMSAGDDEATGSGLTAGWPEDAEDLSTKELRYLRVPRPRRCFRSPKLTPSVKQWYLLFPSLDHISLSRPALNDAAKRSSNCGLVPFVRKIVSSTPLLHASSATSCNIVCNIFNSFCATTGICRNSNWSTCRRALALRNSKSSSR